MLLCLIDAWNQLLTPTWYDGQVETSGWSRRQYRSSKILIRLNASPIDRSSATSIRILQCDHAAIANAPGNLQRANGFLLFRLQRGILPPPPDHAPLQHSARTEAHTVTALLQNGDGISPPIWFQSMIAQRNCSPSCSALQVGPNSSLFCGALLSRLPLKTLPSTFSHSD